MAARGRRTGDSSATRQAILDAGRTSFAESGFERSTLRSIADRAGVDPALIHHYFGSKDGLLAAVVTLPLDPAVVLADVGAGPEPLGHDVVRRIATAWTTEPQLVDRMLALGRTAMTSEHAAELLRDQLGRWLLPVIARLAAQDQRELRVALVMSQVGGVFIARYALRIPAVADLSVDDLVTAVGPTVHRYLTGDLMPASSARRSARG